MKQLRERFADHAGAGADVEHAIRLALAEAAAELGHSQPGGKRLEQLAHALGLLRLVDAGLNAILQFALTRWMNVPLSILPGTGGVRDVPLPDCVEAHLPQDRKPTREDYLRAWDLCAGTARP